MTTSDTPTATLRMLTYNVWFSDREFDCRAAEIRRIISRMDPDVVMLQEVRSDFLEQLLAETWAKDAYHFSRCQPPIDADYFVLMLVRKALRPVFTEHELPTSMGRTLLKATLTINGCPFDVATVHLESLNNAERRAQQLRVAAEILSESSRPAILAGDFNFGDDRDYSPAYRCATDGTRVGGYCGSIENDCLAMLLPEFNDVWLELRRPEPGYTFDSVRNGMLGSYEQMRYDRILARLPPSDSTPGYAWQPSAIGLFGTDPCPAEPPPGGGTPLLRLTRLPLNTSHEDILRWFEEAVSRSELAFDPPVIEPREQDIAFGGIGAGGVPRDKFLWATVQVSPRALAVALNGAGRTGRIDGSRWVSDPKLHINGCAITASSCLWSEGPWFSEPIWPSDHFALVAEVTHGVVQGNPRAANIDDCVPTEQCPHMGNLLDACSVQ